MSDARRLPVETFFADWRQRLTRNLSRRSTSRWDPLTWVSVPDAVLQTSIPMSASRPFDQYRDTPLWAGVEATLTELVTTRELAMNTAPDYVIGYLCQELAAKKLILPAGLER